MCMRRFNNTSFTNGRIEFNLKNWSDHTVIYPGGQPISILYKYKKSIFF